MFFSILSISGRRRVAGQSPGLCILLDVGLVDGDERGVDGDGDGCQMEIVKEDGQVVMEAARGRQVQLECASRDAQDAVSSATSAAATSVAKTLLGIQSGFS